MSLSRKRQKELKRLRSSAEELWGNQQIVLDHANAVAREASKQLGHLTREELVPRVRSGYEAYVRPGYERARDVAAVGRDTAERTLGGLLGSALAVSDIASDTRVRRALERAGARRPAPVERKSGLGFGAILAIGTGVALAAGVAYAVWQTFRADDELWVADEEPSAPPAD